ncbi:hypothetical protein OROGR_016374 [Orobanche gracilis]
MKREHAAQQPYQGHRHPSHTNIHKFHLNSHPSPPPHFGRPITSEGPPTSEEADSHSPTQQPPKRSNNANDDSRGFQPQPTNNDGDTTDGVRRPRGRPAGSKNKPKPPVVVMRETSSETSMSPYVLELPRGVDIIEATAGFCRRRGTGLCVLNGNGVVADVTLKQPSTTPGATVTFHGHFDILSISATLLPVGGGVVYPPSANGLFAISLAGPQGQVIGGLVVGPLVSAGTIYLIAATFNNPSFERLHHEDAAATRDVGHESPQTVSGGESGCAPVYSYQPADVVWAPTARQPKPPSAPPY